MLAGFEGWDGVVFQPRLRMKPGTGVGTRSGSVARLSAQSRGCLGCGLGSGNRLALCGFRPRAVLRRRLRIWTVSWLALVLSAGYRGNPRPDFRSMARAGC